MFFDKKSVLKVTWVRTWVRTAFPSRRSNSFFSPSIPEEFKCSVKGVLFGGGVSRRSPSGCRIPFTPSGTGRASTDRQSLKEKWSIAPRGLPRALDKPGACTGSLPDKSRSFPGMSASRSPHKLIRPQKGWLLDRYHRKRPVATYKTSDHVTLQADFLRDGYLTGSHLESGTRSLYRPFKSVLTGLNSLTTLDRKAWNENGTHFRAPADIGGHLLSCPGLNRNKPERSGTKPEANRKIRGVNWNEPEQNRKNRMDFGSKPDPNRN